MADLIDLRYHPLSELRHALMQQVWDSTQGGERLDTLAVANGILGNPTLLDALAAYHGWRPPARVIETREELDALEYEFPRVIREVPPKGELVFDPQIWENTFQTDGWSRAGHMHDEDDCTPTLPVEVLPEVVDRG